MKQNNWFSLMKALLIVEQPMITAPGQLEEQRRNVKHSLYVVDGEFIKYFIFNY